MRLKWLQRALRARTSMLALSCALAALFGPDAMADDAQRDRAVPCTACHGSEGRAAPDGYYPRIAGKPAGYLFNQLQNFREARRVYAPMLNLTVHMSDANLKSFAEYFASLDLPHAPPRPLSASSTQRQRGEQLVREGDASREVPACAACHGRALTGVQPSVPGLVGLPPDYVIAQIGAWQTGQRRAHAPDCMSTIAGRLRPDDVAAITAWLSAQPVPEGARPAERMEGPPPMDCGGVPR